MTDVFLSYSSTDIESANRIVRGLESAGFTVSWDQSTPPGADWDAWIRARLSESKIVIVLWSRASVASANVRHEAIIARDAGKLLPVLLESLDPRDIPMGLYLIQAVKLADWNGDTSSEDFLRLLGQLGKRQVLPTESVLLTAYARKSARRRLALLAVIGIWVLGAIGTAEFVGWPPPRPPSLVVNDLSCSDAPRDRSVDAWFDAQRPCTREEVVQLRANHDREIANWERDRRSYWVEVALLMGGVFAAPLAIGIGLWAVMQIGRGVVRTLRVAR
jgi:hypothetical protein